MERGEGGRRCGGSEALHAPSTNGATRLQIASAALRMPWACSEPALASSPDVELVSFMIPSTLADSALDGPPVAALAALAVVGRSTRLAAASRCTIWLC